MKNKRVHILTEAAVMVALATVLSLPFLPKLPYGGSVTLCGMLPIVLVGYRHGLKWGVLSGFVFSLLQLFVLGGLGDFKGVSAGTVVGSLIFDFLVAFSVLGLGGIFRKRIENPVLALPLGTAVALLLRYLSHFISGVIFFGNYAEWFFTEGGGAAYGAGILETFSGTGLACVYSLIYNGLYMIPELVVNVVAAVVLGAVIHRLFKNDVTA